MPKHLRNVIQLPSSLLDDVGNGKTWLYSPINGSVTLMSKFEPTLFGDIDAAGVFTAGSHTKDEEISGVIDVTRLLDRHDDNRYSLLISQDHALVAYLIAKGFIDASANAAEIVEGDQLLLMSRPEVEIEDENECG